MLITIEQIVETFCYARSTKLEDGFFLSPVLGESPDGIVALRDDAPLLVVHGITDQAVVGFVVRFNVDTDRFIAYGYENAVFAVAEVEMDFGIVFQERLAVFVFREDERVGEPHGFKHLTQHHVGFQTGELAEEMLVA